MKYNLHTISGKLIIGGMAAVFLPLFIISWLSYVKSNSSLTEITTSHLEDNAVDMARSVGEKMTVMAIQANLIAMREDLIEMAASVEQVGTKASQTLIDDVYVTLYNQFTLLGDHYHGIFVTDLKGELMTGVLENGEEYKGMNIADQDYFQRTVQQKKATITRIIISKMRSNMNNMAAAMEQSAVNTNMVASASELISTTIDKIAHDTETSRDI